MCRLHNKYICIYVYDIKCMNNTGSNTCMNITASNICMNIPAFNICMSITAICTGLLHNSTYTYLYTYVYIYVCIWQRLNKSMPQTLSLEHDQTLRYLKELNNLKCAARNKIVFMRCCFSEF